LKRTISVMLSVILAVSALCGCGAQEKASEAAVPAVVSEPQQQEQQAEPVTLTVTGSWEESPAMEAVASAFSEKYPECSVVYEYVQNYSDSLLTRLKSGDAKLDLFVTNNIQPGSDLAPYALELLSQGGALDLSGTFDGLIQNFVYRDGTDVKKLYAVPLGAELRGMYVNKTLLAKCGLEVPKNRDELLAACDTLLAAGYVPIQANPGRAGQQLMYPYICSMIANAEDYDSVYNKINKREAGISEFFRDPMQLMYTMVEKGYYNYKYIENTTGAFTDGTADDNVRSFLNITGENGEYVKADDVGLVAFMPSVMSIGRMMEKYKEDYHSGIDYEFVLSPVGKDGGYAYMSPSEGMAINSASPNTEWALKFMNFLLEPEMNKKYAELQNITPNTADAFDQIKQKFSVPDDRISQLGSVTFDYEFYGVINETLTEISKANNPKYMIDNGDGTYSMYTLDYYMENMEQRFKDA